MLFSKPIKLANWHGGKKDGPPNLDDLFDQFIKRFSGKKGGQGTSGNFSVDFGLSIVIGFLVLVVLWVISGFYVVRPAEEAVLLRFGRYQQTQGPGLHWLMRGIDSKMTINTSKVEAYEYSSRMLTEDENYVKASLVVYYRVADPEKFFFNMQVPVSAMEKAVASSLRQVVGHTPLGELLTTGKEVVRVDVEKLLKNTLSNYQSGIEITDLKLQEITAPPEVIRYFDDVIKAREEKAKKISQGERYVREIIPIARGQAERLLRAAEAYKERVVLDAQAGVAKFLALLPEYNEHEEITRNRLYFETMNQVLAKLNKIYVEDSNQLLYLPMGQNASMPFVLPKNQ